MRADLGAGATNQERHTMTNTPSNAEIEKLAAEHLKAFAQFTGAGDVWVEGEVAFVRAVLAKWGQPAQAAEPVAWLDPWTGTKVTTDYDAYGKHGIPLYTAPQPIAREPLTDEQIQDLLLCGNPTDEEMRLIRIGWHAANGIKGGQHG